MTEFHILTSIILLLACAVIASTLLRRLHLPPVLGYLAIGVLLGPYSFGLVTNMEATQNLAEFGVVFLMFTIGLEFSLSKLISMRRLVVGLGGLQVLLTTLLAMGITVFLGGNFSSAIVIGGIISMSSTAIVIKQLNDQLELNSPHGHNALGILLFQDLAVIAFIILTPSLAGSQAVFIPLLIALVKAAAVITVILLVGRWVLRPMFHEIAAARSMELFTLAILLVTLSAAWLTDVMGLSMALGAFLAGMMLGETQYRHQIEVEIRPFRDVLLGLFFITIGMLLNVAMLPEIWKSALTLLLAIVVFKTLLITGLARLMGSDPFRAWRTGLILAQGGEFGFALLTLAMENRLLSDRNEQIILAAIVFSMALTPFLIRYNRPLARKFVPKAAEMSQKEIEDELSATAENLNKHVIICGFGRVGQNIARLLEAEGFEFVALDMDPIRVQNARLAGEPVHYGNSRHFSILISAGIAKAKALVLSFDDLAACKNIIPQVRKAYPDLPILVRTRDDSELDSLLKAGATEIIPETLEASLMLGFHTLLLLKVPSSRALRQLRRIRKNRYELLHRVFPSYEAEDLEDIDSTKEQLQAVDLGDSAASIGKSLKELNLQQHEISVTAIRRGAIRHPDPDHSAVLQANDILVLYGTPPHLEHAEKIVLEGSS